MKSYRILTYTLPVTSKRLLSHHRSDPVLFQELRQLLPNIVAEQRLRTKELRSTHGKKSLGSSNLTQLLEGGRDIPAIYSEWSNSSASISAAATHILSNCPTHNTYESLLWYFLTHGQFPTKEQVYSFAKDLQSRRKHAMEALNVSDAVHRLQLLPPQTRGRVHLSMLLMMMQPQSLFFKHRRDTKKADQYQVILDDILTVCAVLPDLLSIVNTHNGDTSPPPGKGSDHVDAFLHAFPWLDVNLERPNVTFKLVTSVGQSLDGGSPLLHIPRLVSCTLSDPFLATAAMLHAYSTSYPGAHTDSETFKSEFEADSIVPTPRSRIALSEGIAITSKATAALVNVFWDRCLTHPLENPKSLDFTSVMEYRD